jgi:hypothetical protein
MRILDQLKVLYRPSDKAKIAGQTDLAATLPTFQRELLIVLKREYGLEDATAEKLLELTKQPGFFRKGNFSLPQQEARRLAAMVYGRSLGDLQPGTVVPIDRMRKEAASLGQTMETFPEVYRFDARSPEKILASDGFQPNPEKPFFGLWEHVAKQNDSGTFVSTTLDPDNPELIDVMKARLSASNSTDLYEYRIRDVLGMKTPAEYGVESEKEVVTNSIPLQMVTEYRRISFKESGFVMSGKPLLIPTKPSEWKPFPERLGP